MGGVHAQIELVHREGKYSDLRDAISRQLISTPQANERHNSRSGFNGGIDLPTHSLSRQKPLANRERIQSLLGCHFFKPFFIP